MNLSGRCVCVCVCCSSLGGGGGGGGGGIQRKLAIVLFPPLELFKEHAAPWLHVNAIIISVFLFSPPMPL